MQKKIFGFFCADKLRNEHNRYRGFIYETQILGRKTNIKYGPETGSPPAAAGCVRSRWMEAMTIHTVPA